MHSNCTLCITINPYAVYTAAFTGCPISICLVVIKHPTKKIKLHYCFWPYHSATCDPNTRTFYCYGQKGQNRPFEQ